MLAEARRRPNTLFVGVDPVHSAMADASRRAAAKPSRGGVANAMFVQASLKTLPAEFEPIADEITMNYPWGLLLHAVALPEAHSLSKLAAIAKRGALVEVYINIHPLCDAAYAARIGLSDALLMTDRKGFVAAYSQADLAVTEIADFSDRPRATRWGKQLAHGSRQILRVRATRM